MAAKGGTVTCNNIRALGRCEARAPVLCSQAMNNPFSRLFIPQAVLEEWSVGESLLLDGENVATLSPSNWKYKLSPAVHVTACVSGRDRGLVGRVRREDDLRRLGAEVSMGTVLWEDEAYEGVEGFLAERIEHAQPATTSPAIAPSSPPTRHPTAEIDALSRAFLNKGG